MKKFLSVLMCLVVLCCGTFIFVGCDKNGNIQGTQVIDLSTLSEGDEIPVYPNCEFNYKIKEKDQEYICHISSITAKFVKTYEIKENDTVEGMFCPYEISISVSGSIDKIPPQAYILIFFESEINYINGIYFKLNIKEDKTFSETHHGYLKTPFLSGFRFYECSF